MPLPLVAQLKNQANTEPVAFETAIQKVFDSVYGLKTARFKMQTRERIEGQMIENNCEVFMQYSPKKIFMRSFKTDGELASEIIYVHGENNNNAIVSPNGFPYINLNLDPLGSIMRDGHHLTILEGGGRYLVDMLEFGFQQYKLNTDKNVQLSLLRVDNKHVEIKIMNSIYTTVSYTVSGNEQVRDICFRMGIPEYKILELNEEVDGYEDLKPGQKIKVPNYYAKKFVLIIREIDYLPVKVMVYDDLGLFAEYTYLSFIVDPALPDNTFDSENPSYTF